MRWPRMQINGRVVHPMRRPFAAPVGAHLPRASHRHDQPVLGLRRTSGGSSADRLPSPGYSELEFPAGLRQGTLCAADDPTNPIGVMLPIAMQRDVVVVALPAQR